MKRSRCSLYQANPPMSRDMLATAAAHRVMGHLGHSLVQAMKAPAIDRFTIEVEPQPVGHDRQVFDQRGRVGQQFKRGRVVEQAHAGTRCVTGDFQRCQPSRSGHLASTQIDPGHVDQDHVFDDELVLSDMQGWAINLLMRSKAMVATRPNSSPGILDGPRALNTGISSPWVSLRVARRGAWTSLVSRLDMIFCRALRDLHDRSLALRMPGAGSRQPNVADP